MSSATHIRSGIVARLFLLGVLVFGQCCLVAAHGFAMERDGHGHMASGAMDDAVVAAHAAAPPDACCIEAPALVARGVAPDKPVLAVAAREVSTPLRTEAAGRVLPSRGPPPEPGAVRRHVLLRTFLI